MSMEHTTGKNSLPYHVVRKLKTLVNILLLFADLFNPFGSYLLIMEFDVPVDFLANGGTQSAHAQLDERARCISFRVVLRAFVVIPIGTLGERVREATALYTKALQVVTGSGALRYWWCHVRRVASGRIV